METAAQTDRGFTLIELIIALGIATLLLAGGGYAVRQLLSALAHPLPQIGDIDALAVLEDRLRAQAAAATVISVSDDGTKLSFQTLDIDHAWHVTTYRYARGLISGQSPENGARETMVDPDVTGFTAQFISAPALAAPGAVAADLYAGHHLPKNYLTRIDDRTALNGVYVVAISRGSQRRTVHLVTDVAPTGFGIQGGAQWHATLSRVGTTKRNGFGTGQHSTYAISGEVDYSTDNWQTAARWCKYTIYDHLQQADPRAQEASVAIDPRQSAEAIFKKCQKRAGEIEPAAVLMNARKLQ